jgi:hypothetical protein
MYIIAQICISPLVFAPYKVIKVCYTPLFKPFTLFYASLTTFILISYPYQTKKTR